MAVESQDNGAPYRLPFVKDRLLFPNTVYGGWPPFLPTEPVAGKWVEFMPRASIRYLLELPLSSHKRKT